MSNNGGVFTIMLTREVIIVHKNNYEDHLGKVYLFQYNKISHRFFLAILLVTKMGLQPKGFGNALSNV